jgi:hypothetical protein
MMTIGNASPLFDARTGLTRDKHDNDEMRRDNLLVRDDTRIIATQNGVESVRSSLGHDGTGVVSA